MKIPMALHFALINSEFLTISRKATAATLCVVKERKIYFHQITIDIKTNSQKNKQTLKLT